MSENKTCCQTQPNPLRKKLKTYFPLLLVVGYLLLGAGITFYFSGSLKTAMRIFMGLFFLVFSFFKFLNLPAFAKSYASYDLPTQAFPIWGFIYPFVELSLGILYLLGAFPIFTNILAIIVMGISLIGVVRAVQSKTKIQCACLGVGFDLPMSTITIIEDGLMIIMAIVMLLTI